MSSRNRILYVCSVCDESGNSEWCGRFKTSELRVLPDGKWVCDCCYDEQNATDLGIEEKPDWDSLPQPPEYGPISAEVVNPSSR